MTRTTSMILGEMDLSFDPLPNSKKTYLPGKQHPQLRVPQREIRLSPTVVNGVETPNEPLRVYDTSGAYTDPDVEIDITEGLPQLRQSWQDRRGGGETRARGRSLTARCSRQATRMAMVVASSARWSFRALSTALSSPGSASAGRSAWRRKNSAIVWTTSNGSSISAAGRRGRSTWARSFGLG